MLATRQLSSSRPATQLQRPCISLVNTSRIVSDLEYIIEAIEELRRRLTFTSMCVCVQAPVVARTPLVCQAAAEAEVVDAASSAPKGGVAHLKFKRGSAFKVSGCLLLLLLLLTIS